MIKDVIDSLRGILAIQGIRRLLWLAIVAAFLFIVFEAHTQYFASASLSSRLELVDGVSRSTASPEQLAQISEIRGQLIAEMIRLEKERNFPERAIGAFLLRFFKGAYVFMPVGWMILRMTMKAFHRPEKQLQQPALQLGFWAISSVVWCATLLGLVSAIWNRSESFIVSWFLFPLCASAVLVAVAGWIAILRGTLPPEKAM
jgi:hypothetical protein